MNQPQKEINKPNILVVDDKQENLRLLSCTLTQNGYEVRGVVNGAMALRVARSAQPNLILLDVMMPDMNGYQVCQKLKEDPATENIPIIFLSASNHVFDKVQALAVGGADYINKPFQIDEVLARIKYQLELQEAQSEIRQLNKELEFKIEERTNQLAATNQELKKEITERREIAKLLKESEEKLHSILNSLEEVIWSSDVNTYQLQFLNNAADKVYGRPAAELFQNPNLRLEVVYPEDRDRVTKTLEKLKEKNRIDIEYRILQPNGKIRWLWERTRIVYDEKNQSSRIDGIIWDITDRKLVEEQLSYEAYHDALTGLPNRVFFIEQVEKALEKLKTSPHYLFAVLFIDLDRFKVVNDSLGHTVGDQLLVEVAYLLQKCLRSQDIVARLGGDEFTILLQNIAQIEDAIKVINRIFKEFICPFILESHTIFSNASIGLVLGTNQYKKASEILRDADIAMYRAKAQGKGRYTIFNHQMYAQTLELLELENDLRQALKNQEFFLCYQPIICLSTHQIYGFEALLRWQHPEKGLIPPDKFIHIAEETGLIITIGEWVLEEACRQLRTWQIQYPHANNLKVSVNLASQQIIEPNFLNKLTDVLKEIQLPGQCLNLELTETTLMDYGENTVELLKTIRENHIELSIDDFGTGYSSLRYLHRFPVNNLKIDRSFVTSLTEEKENFAIVRTIITLAHTLGMKVVAEGVETQQQLQILQNLDCKYCQGYLFSRPLDSQSAESFLKDNNSFEIPKNWNSYYI